jgi:hypothetical protein
MKYLVLIFLLCGCVTKRKLDKLCELCPRKDSIVEKIIEVDKVLPPVPGPTVYIDNPCTELCDSLGRLKQFEIHKEENGIKTTVRTNTLTNSLEIESKKGPDTIKVQVPCKEKYTTVEAKCKLSHRSKWDYFTEIGFYILGGTVVVFLGLKRLKIL